MDLIVTIATDEGQGCDLIAHDVPETLVTGSVEALQEAIATHDDARLVVISVGTDHHSSNTILHLQILSDKTCCDIHFDIFSIQTSFVMTILLSMVS